MESVVLDRVNLPDLPPAVERPRYDVAAVRPGIVHLGLGGFHRAHMARYTHDLMQVQRDAVEWGIVGAGLLPNDRGLIDTLARQDMLYALVECSSEMEAVTVIGSLADVVFAGETRERLLQAIDHVGIRIVSLTVTESGYCLNPKTRKLDPSNAAIVADLANPEQPRSAIGVIVEACRRRRAAGAAGFTALSCDNIQHNGVVLRDAVMTLARMRDPSLAEWIDARVSFPSTMVDRITPVTREEKRNGLAEHHGVTDDRPVFCESFRQWVVEDHFVSGRPAWEIVGAQFVDDVAPYEFMKLRLLNASHLAIAGLGRLADYVTIDETMADPLIQRFMVALMDRETGPTLQPVPGVDLPAYKATLVERFANPAIRDTVERVNTDAPLNVLLDTIEDRIRSGEPVDLLALALAAWLRRVRGEDEAGQSIDVRHPLAELLREKAVLGGPDPSPLLSITDVFGQLGSDPRLTTPVAHWLAALYRHGSRATLAQASKELSF